MNRRLSFIILCLGLILVTVAFGVRAKYAPAVHYMIVGVQFGVICLASWRVGAWAIAAGAGRRRNVATAAALLVMPLHCLPFLPASAHRVPAKLPQKSSSAISSFSSTRY